MKQKLGSKFWFTLVIFSLMGQVAWVVENMYFNVFIYKMFHASASDISLMVAASAVAATLTTWLIGALSDKVGKRKVFICGGYMVWGISILSFSLIRMEVLTPITGSTTAAAALGISLVILMDCVMTFFGSSANDASFNAWLTDMGDESNRGKIEGINSMMPLVAILVVFGGFMAFDLDKSASWVMIFTIIGAAVLVIGLLGFFLIEDHVTPSEETSHYWSNVLYSFKPSVVAENKLLYAVVGAFAVFGISIQIFMPYLILYYEKTLGMENYVLVMAPAIVLAAVVTAVYGRLYDQLGFNKSVVPTVVLLMVGYVLLYVGRAVPVVFVGSFLMMSGYLTGMAVFGAMIRDHIPENKAGMFQGLRIFGQVFVPGIIGPAIGAKVLSNAKTVTNSDGTTSFIPNGNIYIAAFVAAVLLLVVLFAIFHMIRVSHYELHAKNEEIGWESYPRPQMKRNSYFSLNGEWSMNEAKVRVPFPLESRLSGWGKKAPRHMEYRRTFQLPEGFAKKHVFLHFDAVDQIAEVSVNGMSFGKHEGGYLPFVYDITEAIRPAETNEIMVKVTDGTSHRYPYGKQRKLRGGMWYTPVSGIWKSVWIESTPETYIGGLKLTPNQNTLQLELEGNMSEWSMKIYEDGDHLGEDKCLGYGGEIFSGAFTDKKVSVCLSDLKNADGSNYTPHLWTPEKPYLYHATLRAGEDEIETYFAMRTVDIRDVNGVKRLCLNGEPIFLHGVLDQGYFCDGIYLPAQEKEYERDILRMKSLGFNTLRKHIKVEPDYFYYACDRLGMLVLQDMVNNGHYSFLRDTAFPTLGWKKYRDTNRLRSNARKKIFEEHTRDTITALYNHPSIIGYTIFNEGWGQFDADRIYDEVKSLDKTRVIDITSGWFHQEKCDIDSRHIYFDTQDIEPAKDVPIFVSECGGYSHGIPGHIYSKYGLFGYGSYEDTESLTDAIINMYEKMILPAITTGLCGCIYTQLSDVEDEINGLYTYDRKECKVNPAKMKELQQKIKKEICKKA